MAKLLTDRTKEEMIDIREQVYELLVGLKYKDKEFIGCSLIIKLIGEIPVYKLTLVQEVPNDIVFEAVDYKQLMLRFDGFIKAIKWKLKG